MNNPLSPVPGIDLALTVGYFGGERYIATQASPESVRTAAAVYADMLLEPRCTLVMMRASIKRELEIFLEPSPIAYCLALLKTGLRVSASLVYYGDDFTYRGQDTPWTLTAKAEVSRSLDSVAGVALSLTRYTDSEPTSFLFVDRKQIDTANEWFLSGACGGFIHDDKTLKALMLNAAIRYLIKWVINEKFTFPTDFSPYLALVELHRENGLKTSRECAIRDASSAVSSPRKFRTVRAIPSVTEALMSAGKTKAPTTMLKTFQIEEPPLPVVEDFDSFCL